MFGMHKLHIFEITVIYYLPRLKNRLYAGYFINYLRYFIKTNSIQLYVKAFF